MKVSGGETRSLPAGLSLPLHLPLRGPVPRAGVQADGAATLHPVPE